MIFEPFPQFLPSEYRIKFANDWWEHREAAALRRRVFCDEQGIFSEDDRDALDDIASAHGVTPTGIAVAWITRHPANMQVVLGTTKPERVTQSAAGSDIRLDREEWYRLFTAAGHVLP